MLPDDPGLWSEIISSHVAQILIVKGPHQIIEFDFPVSISGRKFSKNYYDRVLSNGEKVHRDWLIYSKYNNSVYCFPCKIFDVNKSSLTDKLGYSVWQHLSLTLNRHEKSLSHNENIKKWISMIKSLKTKTTVDSFNQRLLESERQHWYSVIQRIIAIIQYLSRQSLVFRGSSDTLYEDSNGNFLKAVEMIASFDAVMRNIFRELKSLKFLIDECLTF